MNISPLDIIILQTNNSTKHYMRIKNITLNQNLELEITGISINKNENIIMKLINEFNNKQTKTIQQTL